MQESQTRINPENAVLLLENIFVRERFDWEKWDLRQMHLFVESMKKIVDKTAWRGQEASLAKSLESSLDELLTIIKNKDATRVAAGHTHVEQALSDLRSAVFGL